MDTSSISALRNYQIARKALQPGQAGQTGQADSAKPGAPSALAKGVEEFSQVFDNVEAAASGMASGAVSAQSVVEALATAEVALEGAVTIRNRVVEAYQELLRMPV